MSRIDSIAVVVPCHNAAATLAAAVDSAIEQDAQNVDVIVVDDGSTDASADVARRYGQRIRLLTGPNRGVSAARNAGLAASKAAWVVFLDADDRLEPGTLGKRLAVARTERADVVISEWIDVTIGRDGAVEGERHRQIDWKAMARDAENAIAAGAWATTSAILYRRRLVEKIEGFRPDLPIIQDARLLFDAAFHGARLVPAAHTGARYHIREGSLSRRNPAAFHRDLLLNARGIEELWRAQGRLDATRRRLLADLYDLAARGFMRAADPTYFAALAAQQGLELPLSRHGRIGSLLARMVGLRQARAMLALTGRA